MKDLQ